MNQHLFQIIDANLNRGREGLRVCEDIARFAISDKGITGSLKNIRHGMTNALLGSKRLSFKKLITTRDTDKDVFKCIDFKKKRGISVSDIFMSNIERVKESLRVLEECCRIIDEEVSQSYRKLRFNTYDVEKKAVEKIRPVSCSGQKGLKRQ